MAKPISTSEFLAELKGRKVQIVPKISVELEDGGSMVIEADCSGCNNANQPFPFTDEDESYPKRWNK